MADEGRDEHGRFVEGNHPTTGFHTNPERRGRFPGNRHSFSKAVQRLLDMTDSELASERERADLTQAERIALNMLDRATDTHDPQQLAAFKQLMDRAEGKPPHYSRGTDGIRAADHQYQILRRQPQQPRRLTTTGLRALPRPQVGPRLGQQFVHGDAEHLSHGHHVQQARVGRRARDGTRPAPTAGRRTATGWHCTPRAPDSCPMPACGVARSARIPWHTTPIHRAAGCVAWLPS